MALYKNIIQQCDVWNANKVKKIKKFSCDYAPLLYSLHDTLTLQRACGHT